MTAAWANMSCAIISDLWFPVRQRTLATAVAVTGPPVGQALGFAVPALLTVSQRTQVQQLMPPSNTTSICYQSFIYVILFDILYILSSIMHISIINEYHTFGSYCPWLL